MQKRTRTIVLTASMAVACIALGATIASAANGASPKVPALQGTGQYVFACVNPEGGIDYLEFRAPLPHQCWFAGESLWYWDAVPLAQPTTSQPTYSYSPTPTASATTAAAPVLANIETGALAYTSGATAVPITTMLTVTDANANAMISGATVSITAGLVSGDVLALPTTTGITATYSASTGVLTLTGTATPAAYQAALRTVTFAATGTSTASTRTVSFQVTDSTSTSDTSNTETRTIDVSAQAA
jgi:hypothetical protein